MSLQAYGESGSTWTGYEPATSRRERARLPSCSYTVGKWDASGGENAEDWDLNFPVLARRFKVILIDRIGQGYTDNPKRDEDCTMAASVRHVTRFLALLGKGPYNLVGHSRGGYVAARIALDTPASSIAASSSTATRRHPVRAATMWCSAPTPTYPARSGPRAGSTSSTHSDPTTLPTRGSR